MPRKRKPAYDAIIRFRAFKALAERIERVVAARGYGDSADFMREGTAKIVESEERRLGLPALRIAEESPRYRTKKRKGGHRPPK